MTNLYSRLRLPWLATIAAVLTYGGITAAANGIAHHDHRCRATGSNTSHALPALYTSEQADSGKQKYMTSCALCHGPTLEGRAGPALKGPNFASTKANFRVGDVFVIVSQNMPATAPGSLSHDDYVELMAFLLQQNGYPAGSKALTFDTAQRSKVKLLYHGN